MDAEAVELITRILVAVGYLFLVGLSLHLIHKDWWRISSKAIAAAVAAVGAPWTAWYAGLITFQPDGAELAGWALASRVLHVWTLFMLFFALRSLYFGESERRRGHEELRRKLEDGDD